MKRLILDHVVSTNLLTQAMYMPAMLNDEIERAGREAVNGYQDHQLVELVREGVAEGADCVRIRVIIETMKLTDYNEHLHKD